MAKNNNQLQNKQNINAVQEIVGSRCSRNDIFLVLQHYENNVTQAIDSIMEDGAKEILKEWQYQGSKQPIVKKKKNRNKKGTAARVLEDVTPVTEDVSPVVEEVTHVMGEVTPVVDKFTPVVEKVIPVVDKFIPIVEKVIPVVKKVPTVVKKVTPVVEKVIPVMENVTPVKEKVTTVMDKFTPVVEKVTPVVNKITPVVNKITPVVNKITPVVNKITPVVNKITPVVNKITPVVNKFTPVVEKVTPTVEDVTPSVEEVTPYVKEVTPYVEEVTISVEEVTPVLEEVSPVLQEIIDEKSEQPFENVDQLTDRTIDLIPPDSKSFEEPAISVNQLTDSTIAMIPHASLSCDRNESPDIDVSRIRSDSLSIIVSKSIRDRADSLTCENNSIYTGESNNSFVYDSSSIADWSDTSLFDWDSVSDVTDRSYADLDERLQNLDENYNENSLDNTSDNLISNMISNCHVDDVNNNLDKCDDKMKANDKSLPSSNHLNVNENNKINSHKNRSQTDHRQSSKKSTSNKGTEKSISNKGSDKSLSNKIIEKPLSSKGIEKSSKDVHRFMLSLQNHKLNLNKESDRSLKAINKLFEEIKEALSSRQTELIIQMAKVREDGTKILSDRIDEAAKLKQLADKGSSISNDELVSLRSEIKSLVSDRRSSEEIGRTTRFVCDYDQMLMQAHTFGTVVPVIPVRDEYIEKKKLSTSRSSGPSIPSITSRSSGPSIPSVTYVNQNYQKHNLSSSNGLLPTSNGLLPSSNGLLSSSNGLQNGDINSHEHVLSNGFSSHYEDNYSRELPGRSSPSKLNGNIKNAGSRNGIYDGAQPRSFSPRNSPQTKPRYNRNARINDKLKFKSNDNDKEV